MERSTSPATTPSGRIFMSYRRQDTAYATGWLFDRLAETYGRAHVFKDVDSLQPGDDFVAVIETAVGACSVLLALIGDEWLTVADGNGRRRIDDPHDFVRLEIEAALTRGVPVIPILVDGARMPQPTEVPDSLVPLVRRQALELSPARFDFDVSQLRLVLDRALTPSSAGGRPGARRTVAIGVALALVAAIGVVLVVSALSRPDRSPPSSSGPSSGSQQSTSQSTTSQQSTSQSTTSQQSTTSSGTVVSRTSSTRSVVPTGFVVQSQGQTTLVDFTQGLDLTSGRQVLGFQAQLAWLGPVQQLSIAEQTTLGATVLDEVSFRDVTAARLASTRYRAELRNGFLSPADLPVGKVLAVRVDERTYAKVVVVRYGPGDALELRWVTYRAS
jgi:hypothetical protein